MEDARTENAGSAGVTLAWQTSTLNVDGGAGGVALRTCQPVASAVRGQVVIAGAIGVPQRFYTDFAQWLAGHGYAVTTFDYRCHADSLQGPLKHARADLLDWAQDCAAVAAHCKQRLPALPLLWVGHSVGAQLPGANATPLPIDGMLAVASGSGYWRDNAPPTRRKVLLWWYGIAPLITSLYGCLPGKQWGLVGDLPAGVLWQWRKWCLHPNYGIGVEGEPLRTAYAAARYPLHALSVEDDEMMSWRSTTDLLSWYRHCPQSIERLRVLDVPQRRIGHFGFFRAEMQAHLWPRALAVLERWTIGEDDVTPKLQASATVTPTVPLMARKRISKNSQQVDLFEETSSL